MRSPFVGRVEESRHQEFRAGEFVTGLFGWQDYAVVDVSAIQRKVPAAGLPISTSLAGTHRQSVRAWSATSL